MKKRGVSAKILVEVTDEIMHEASLYDGCPVELAVSRTLESVLPDEITVNILTTGDIDISKNCGNTVASWLAPKGLKAWVDGWDRGKVMEPFSFYLVW